MIEWLEAALVAVAGLHGLAVLIVNATDTPKDDEIVAKVYRVVEYLAGVVTSKAKQ